MRYYSEGRNAALRQLLPAEKTAAVGFLSALAPYLGLAGHAAGATAALHGGANTTFKALRAAHMPQWAVKKIPALGKVPFGHEYETQSMAAGFNAERKGLKANPGLERVMMTGMGPETAVSSQMGAQLAGAFKGKSPYEIRRDLKAVRRSIAQSPTIAGSPMGKPVVGAINHILSGQPTPLESVTKGVGLGPVPKNARPSHLQVATPLALGVGAAGLQPHSLIHFGINGTRELLANSEAGKKFMATQLEQGLLGHTMPKWRERLYDFGLSPAALDTRRTGAAIGDALEKREPGAVKLVNLIRGRARANPQNQARVNAAMANAQNRSLAPQAAPSETAGAVSPAAGTPSPAAASDNPIERLINDPAAVKRFMASPRGLRMQKDPALQRLLASGGYAPQVQAAVAADPRLQQTASAYGLDLSSLLGSLT